MTAWSPTVADELEFAHSQMAIRAPHVPPSESPVAPIGRFDEPILPWVGSPDLFGKALSPREIELLVCCRDGATNKQAALALGCSEQTVKNHMTSILAKLRVPDRTAAVIAAIRGGVIELGAGPTSPGLVVGWLTDAERRLLVVIAGIETTLAQIASLKAGGPIPSIEPMPRYKVAPSHCVTAACDEPVAPYRGFGRPATHCELHLSKRAAA